jgi:hypothetical protein
MKNVRLFQWIVAVVLMMTGTRAAFADAAGAWTPVQSGDAAQIWNWGYYVYNADTSGAHTVVHGILAGQIKLGNSPYTTKVYGYTNGGTGQSITCWFDVTDLGTHNTVETSTVSGTTAGYVTLNMSITTPNTSGPFLGSLRCQIPKANSNGNAFIFGSDEVL